MQIIEMEIVCDTQEEAQRLTEKLQNGDHWIGTKHGKWVLFITCRPDEILHLGQELHYELCTPKDD